MRNEYDYDDVLIIPKSSTISSREEIHLRTDISPTFQLYLPIMAAPMRGIVGPSLINELGYLGGIGFLHRFHFTDTDFHQNLGSIETSQNFGASISTLDNEHHWELALGYGARIICVDVANGYMDKALKKCQQVADYITSHRYDAYVMGGCVATIKGCERLYDAGCKFIRVGIGSGRLCTTRNATGIGRPQISALLECGGQSDRYYTVADGGIRNSGDAAKALAAGADFLMMGSWFAQAFESDNNGVIHGMASASHQIRMTNSKKSVEGISIPSKKIAPLDTLLDTFVWNLKSAFSYVGARTIEEFQALAEFVHVSNSAIKKDVYE